LLVASGMAGVFLRYRRSTVRGIERLATRL
jgi:hypothetical protein